VWLGLWQSAEHPKRSDDAIAGSEAGNTGGRSSGKYHAEAATGQDNLTRMYAVIKTGGRQYRVEEGQVLDVNRIGDVDATESLTPVLLVDGEKVLATPDQLSKAKVGIKVVEDTRGPKINGFTYKNKSNQRKRWGHRQAISRIEVTSIKAG
jgi:large subunit ribosomal protein L21